MPINQKINSILSKINKIIKQPINSRKRILPTQISQLIKQICPTLHSPLIKPIWPTQLNQLIKQIIIKMFPAMLVIAQWWPIKLLPIKLTLTMLIKTLTSK